MNLENRTSSMDNISDEDLRKQNIKKIEKLLQSNIFGCDLMLSLFYSSLHSCKCLQPFPPGFCEDETETVDKLKRICSSITDLKKILLNPEQLSTEAETIKVLKWLFSDKNLPKLKLVNMKKFNLPSKMNITTKPNHIFEVVYPQQSTEAWNKLKKSNNVILALHGSKLQNFFSILRFGLQQQVEKDKEVLFGQGIYFSTEFSVSVIFAPFSNSWPKSLLGTQLSIIALCEILDIKDKVQKKEKGNSEKSPKRRNLGGEIPDKYLVVTDNNITKVKYLLVYSKNVQKEQSWLSKNMLTIAFLLYFLLLCIIGSYKSMSVMFRRFWSLHLRRYLS